LLVRDASVAALLVCLSCFALCARAEGMLAKASQVPSFAEPWFLKFNADCEFRIVMSPNDLKDAGLEALGKKWK